MEGKRGEGPLLSISYVESCGAFDLARAIMFMRPLS